MSDNAARPPQPGDWLVIFTDLNFHNGQLAGQDYHYFYLLPGSVIIFDTGDLETFYRDGDCPSCEVVPTDGIVSKHATRFITRWPHGRAATKREAKSKRGRPRKS